MALLNFGYYITSPVPKPHYMSLECEKVLTVSNCICDLHPDLTGCFWDNRAEEQKAYQKTLGLSDSEFSDMKKAVADLFENQRFETDSRFYSQADAHLFMKKYLYNLLELKVICLAIEDEYKNILCEEVPQGMKPSPNIPSIFTDEKIAGKLLGYDILGWDCSAFHSYLCNGFEKVFSQKYPLKINELGMIQNPYEEVKDVAGCLDGGEPVIWLPFFIYECNDPGAPGNAD